MTEPTALDGVTAPSFLRDLPIWLVWRLEGGEDGKKPRKVPYYVNGPRRHGIQGSPEDLAKLTNFEAAKAYATQNNYGLGIAMSRVHGFSVVDFDCCVAGGQINPDIEPSTRGTYAEYSPSGTGVHVFIVGNYGDRKKTAKDGHWGVEVFNDKGFLTFTGNVVHHTKSDIIAGPTLALRTILTDSFTPRAVGAMSCNVAPIGLDKLQLNFILSNLDADMGYHDWVRVGMALHHETSGSPEGFLLWDSWSANSQKYEGEEYNAAKWESFGNNPSGIVVTMRSYMSAVGVVEPITFEPITELEQDIPLAPEPKSDNPFGIISVGELTKRKSSLKWLLKGFLPKANLGVIYGPSGAGKSFVVLDICASIARGVDWNGLRCTKTPGSILYVVAEGSGGFPNRITAYCNAKGITSDDLQIDVIVDVPLSISNNGNVGRLIKYLKSHNKYDLIILDTFAQVTPGMNENDAEDMSSTLGYIKDLSFASGAMVLLVHHSGKDAAKGARGHSSLIAASDAIIEVSRDGEYRKLKVVKLKDGIDGQEFGFRLVDVPMGEDEDGDVVSSAIVEYCDVVNRPKKLRENQRGIYDVLQMLNGSWATVNHVIELYLDNIEDEEERKKIRKDNIRRTISAGINVFIEQNDNGEIRLLDE